MARAPQPERARAQTGGRRLATAAALAAFCTVWPGPDAAGRLAAAPPDQISLDLEARLEALSAAEALPENRELTAAILIARADLAVVAARSGTDPDLGPPLGPVLEPRMISAPATLPACLDAACPGAATADGPAAEPVTGGTINMRLALTMLSVAHGDDGNGSVLVAQSDPDRSALVLKSGSASLADLAALLNTNLASRTVELRLPLVIWPGASLRLSPGEALHLSRPDGAFVMNFGGLYVDGATIAGVGDANSRIRSFRPFVVTADAGRLDLRGARLTGLGFGETRKFSGVSVLRSLLQPADRPARIENTLFEDVMSVSFSGDAGAMIRGNRFRDARGPALTVTQSTGTLILSNLFAGRMPTNAIRLDQGAAGARIEGNVILGGVRAGIAVRQDSPGARIAGNVVWARHGGGILVRSSACPWIEGNLVIGNAQKGIELRDAPGSMLRANSVLSNDSGGLWVADQPTDALTRIEGNVLAFNASGLSGASGARLLLQGNDLSRQFLQFLSGDLAPQATHLARDMRGDVPLLLSAAGSGPAPAPDPGPDSGPDPACQP